MECGGIERVDTSWVAAGYQANVAPVEKDGRRVSRTLFKTRRLRLLSKCQLACGTRRILAARYIPCLSPLVLIPFCSCIMLAGVTSLS